MNNEYDSPIVLDTTAADASVIWLHGLGDDGNGFLSVAQHLQMSLNNVRFILPHAPFRPVTVNGGYVMRAWYDIYTMGFRDKEDETGFKCSQEYVEALLIEEQAQGIPIERIILAGFSQGGALSLYTALQSQQNLAGIIALSCYLPLEEQLKSANQLPRAIFLAHGRQDPLLPISLSHSARQQLQHWQHQIEWHEYDMEHAVCPQEIDDILHWIKNLL